MTAENSAGVTHRTAVERSVAVDRFRGLAIMLMVVANFLSGNRFVPAWLKHAPDIGLTAIDLIAPFFIFAIGLTLVDSARRRAEREGRRAAIRHHVVRYLAILGIGAVISAGEQLVGQSGNMLVWGVLQAIGVAGLLMLPVIFAPATIRLTYAVVLLACFQLASAAGWNDLVFRWSHGGLPGSISWAGMLALATVFPDLESRHRLAVTAASLLLLGSGLALSLIVAVSKNRVSASYVVLTTGASGLLYTLFMLTDGIGTYRPGVLTWWGRNPLLLYLLHYVLLAIVVLPDTPAWYVEAAPWLIATQGVVLIALLTAVAWLMHRHHLTVRL